MKGVQCYELFGGIALKNHAFSFLLDVCSALDISHYNVILHRCSCPLFQNHIILSTRFDSISY